MMQSSEWVLKAILSRCSEEKRKVLESFLSPEEKEKLDAMPSFEGTFDEPPPEGGGMYWRGFRSLAKEFGSELPGPKGPGFWRPDEKEFSLFDRIHWSWFLPILKAHAPKEQKLFVSALPASFQEPLRDELKIRELDESLSAIGKRFLLKVLQANLTGEKLDLLPISLLPPSSFSSLLMYDKNKIIRFIDLLSLYDLAETVQRIVETKILKKIYSFLSGEELNFLKVAMAQKQKSALAPMKLESWDGSENQFRVLLHKRGLARFGIVLSKEHPDFIWYICHGLDIGRGSSLEKCAQMEATMNVKKMVFKQAETVLQFGISSSHQKPGPLGPGSSNPNSLAGDRNPRQYIPPSSGGGS